MIVKWKIFGFALGAMSVLAALWTWRASVVYDWEFGMAALIYGLTLLGPFTELVAYFEPYMPQVFYLWALANLVLLFAHPIFPRLATAIVTIVAFLFWLVAGVILVYSNA